MANLMHHNLSRLNLLREAIREIILEEYKFDITAAKDFYNELTTGRGDIDLSDIFSDSDLRTGRKLSKDNPRDKEELEKLRTAAAECRNQASQALTTPGEENTHWWEFTLCPGEKQDPNKKTKFYITISQDIENIINFYKILPEILVNIKSNFCEKGYQIKTKYNEVGKFYDDGKNFSIKNDFLIFYSNHEIINEIGNFAKSLISSKGISLEDRPFEVGVDRKGKSDDADGLSHSLIIKNLFHGSRMPKDIRNQIKQLFKSVAVSVSFEEFSSFLHRTVQNFQREISKIMVENPEFLQNFEENIRSPTNDKKISDRRSQIVLATLRDSIERSKPTPSGTRTPSGTPTPSGTRTPSGTPTPSGTRTPSGGRVNYVSSDEPIVLMQGSNKIEFKVTGTVGKNLLSSNGFEDSGVYGATQFKLTKTNIGWKLEHFSDAQNKTYVNGALTSGRILAHGDVISIGNESQDKGRGKIQVV